jgi:hypothetical protein
MKFTFSVWRLELLSISFGRVEPMQYFHPAIAFCGALAKTAAFQSTSSGVMQ